VADGLPQSGAILGKASKASCLDPINIDSRTSRRGGAGIARERTIMNHPFRSACLIGLAAGLALSGCQSPDHGDDLAKPPFLRSSSPARTASPNPTASPLLTYVPDKPW
jgi:hypothetical protein